MIDWLKSFFDNFSDMKKINIAKLLKDCLKGMELDCTMYDRVTFDEVITVIGFDDKKRVKIILSTHYSDGTKDEINLTEYGTYTYDETAKCVIFPKGKTTWEGFTPPCKFKDDDKNHLWTIQDAKDGDVIFYDDGWTCIFKCIHGIWYSSYCFITSDGEFHTGYERHAVDSTINGNVHLATNEQCNLLFQKIKEAGYMWNPNTKTLEKLIEPVFKAGDRIGLKCENVYWDIKAIEDDWYICNDGAKIHIGEQHHYELVHVKPKFKDGDIVATQKGTWVGIVKNEIANEYFDVHCAMDYTSYGKFYARGEFCFSRFATSEEKQKLFDAIKAHGCKWYPETKTLEKLVEPKFKVGDRVKSIYNNFQYYIKKLTNTHYTLVEVEKKFKYTIPIVEDKNWELVPQQI